MTTLTPTLFRLAIATMALLVTGCGTSPNETTWPHLLVSGTVSTAAGTPANSATVRITTWASPRSCGDSVAISSVTATTTTAGAYQARVYTTIGPFTGCLRVEAITVHADTSLTAVPDGAQVKVNLRLP